jgi:hypothetical protein
MKGKETIIAHAESAGAMLINQSLDNTLQFLKRKLLYWEIARGVPQKISAYYSLSDATA